MRICYYELLGVEKKATELDLKKAYRKQALLWHPDKNGDRVEEATDRFALIQEAYEILSDPQERAWYDGHRDAILRGDNPNHHDSSSGTTAEDLMRYFSISEFKGYDDTPKGFYNVYRKIFETLAEEEEEAYRNHPPEYEIEGDMVEYPLFGTKETPFANEYNSGGQVRDFYAAWSNFSSVKTFMWMDKWRLSDAPNRNVRRVMEKQNKKIRESAKKEYNETVRKLVEYVRKRDPRVKAYTLEEQKRKEAAAAEQKARVQREKEEQKVKMSSYQVPDWAKVDEEEYDLDEEVEEINEFYCVVCEKSYKSERQYTSHEKSKKHLKSVELLREQMLADDEFF
ncbi:hypothetical protein BDB01DRAFT_114664 [Pilobolus umbonatus]|nr:hypothetical protein BDB01DRAFT_114664 [Pilobolus umbonatus]